MFVCAFTKLHTVIWGWTGHCRKIAEGLINSHSMSVWWRQVERRGGGEMEGRGNLEKIMWSEMQDKISGFVKLFLQEHKPISMKQLTNNKEPKFCWWPWLFQEFREERWRSDRNSQEGFTQETRLEILWKMGKFYQAKKGRYCLHRFTEP